MSIKVENVAKRHFLSSPLAGERDFRRRQEPEIRGGGDLVLDLTPFSY